MIPEWIYKFGLFIFFMILFYGAMCSIQTRIEWKIFFNTMMNAQNDSQEKHTQE